MRCFVLTLAAAAVLALAAGTAQAGNPYGGYYGPNYAPSYGFQVNNYYGDWGGGPRYPGGSYYQGSDPHTQAVRRIMASHSRYRFYTHPRSTYNSPPMQADYFGWGY